jgi:phenylacetic acid degradation operon negative regulatory protein
MVDTERNEWGEAPSATRLVVALLLALDGQPLPTRIAVPACALFGIGESSVRVALVRLSAAGRIESTGRGEYRFSEAENVRALELSRWRDALSRVRAWKGAYAGAHVGSIGRGDRSALRRRTRALELLGMVELGRDLYVRPDNLEGGVSGIRERLRHLGLDHEAPVFRLSELDPTTDARLRSSWDGKALGASYKRTRTRIEKWLKKAPVLEPEVAAREAFLLGSAAIRQVLFDPWLPAPLVDEDLRRSFFEAVVELDRRGRDVWLTLFALLEGGEARALPH